MAGGKRLRVVASPPAGALSITRLLISEVTKTQATDELIELTRRSFSLSETQLSGAAQLAEKWTQRNTAVKSLLK